MKKLATILTATVMLFSSFAFAIDSDQVNAKIKAAFMKDFSAAADVSWEKIRDFYVVKFTINQVELNAAYNEEGELVGASREMEISRLPINVLLALNKKYDGYTFSKKAHESTLEGITTYSLAVENDQQILKLKCSVSGNVEVTEKIKKK